MFNAQFSMFNIQVLNKIVVVSRLRRDDVTEDDKNY